MTPKSVTDSRNTKAESEKTVSQTARAAFSKKSKTVEQVVLDHGSDVFVTSLKCTMLPLVSRNLTLCKSI